MSSPELRAPGEPSKTPACDQVGEGTRIRRAHGHAWVDEDINSEVVSSDIPVRVR